MAKVAKPTNERIIEMLDQVLRELDEVKTLQAQFVADVRTPARPGDTK